jgi:hypothetical protein
MGVRGKARSYEINIVLKYYYVGSSIHFQAYSYKVFVGVLRPHTPGVLSFIEKKVPKETSPGLFLFRSASALLSKF